jgi:tRNA threonylcarbamoyladenosine biosynthesis protein TsaE
VSRVLVTHSEAETVEAGRALAGTLSSGAVLLLSGDLGAGKTAFIRGIAAGLEIDPLEVSSPTFTLIHEYRGGRLPLHHVDLYRLESVEVDDLGLDDLTLEDGITAIEWPDRLPRPMPGSMTVRIDHGKDSERTITIEEGTGDSGLGAGN